MGLLLLSLANGRLRAQDSLHVYFLHGSKPANGFKDTESKWFGGKKGGHVGIAWSADSILNFVPAGRFHKVARRDPKHSRFVVNNAADFWNVFGGSGGEMMTTRISIPVHEAQYREFLQIKDRYLAGTPYDYAFLGIRCASATDEILAKLAITRKRSYWGTIFGTFHPKVLRRRLLRMAPTLGWVVRQTPGSARRVWQR